MPDKDKKPLDAENEEKEGWEALEEDAAEGSLAPSAELEEAMREAADAVGATQAGKRGKSGSSAKAEALEEELTATRDRLVRLQADFDNSRKRMLKDRQEAHQYGHENLVKDLLGTVDNLERAIEHARKSGGGDFEGMLQGVELVQREFLGALAKHGVEPIEADGEPFDPAVHEAMSQQEDDSVPANTVVAVFQKGYGLRDRLLRPARVVVSKASEAKTTSQGAAAEPRPDADVEE